MVRADITIRMALFMKGIDFMYVFTQRLENELTTWIWEISSLKW